MIKNSIVVYNGNKISSYFINLNKLLINIRALNEINKEIISGNWDLNIKYRSSSDKSLMDLHPRYYLERGKWVDFKFLLENEKINKLKLFTIESLISGKIRLVLSLF